MRTTAKADYAVRAAVELAAVGTGKPVKADDIAVAQSTIGTWFGPGPDSRKRAR